MSAGLGTTTTTGLDVDVVGATSGTHTATGLDVTVGSADVNYAAKFSGGGIMIKEQANADTDKAAKETADKINAADGMIFQTEKQLKEFGEKLSDDKKGPIEEALAELKKAHESKDLGAIDTAMEKINNAWKSASEEMYKASQEGSAASEGAPAEDAANSDDVTDVEFEEVKEDKKDK